MRIPAARSLVTAWPRPDVDSLVSSRWAAPFGMFAAVDLHDRARPRFEEPDSIRLFLPSVTQALGMSAHGPLQVTRAAGRGGWSAVQLVETGWIAIHADARARRCVIDVFSCEYFDPQVVAAVAVEHFGGRRTLRVYPYAARTA